jgi:ABC-type glycerol-3-phosphate transport system substrate-binding protein
LEIKLDYRPVPYLNLHEQILKSMANQTPVDILTVDYIWPGEFAEKGFLTDLTNYTKKWGRSSDWYEGNWDERVYEDEVRIN